MNDTEDQVTVWDTHSAPPGIGFRLFPGDAEDHSVRIDKRQIAGTSLQWLASWLSLEPWVRGYWLAVLASSLWFSAKHAAASCYLMFANRRFLVQMTTNGSVLGVFQLGDEANSISLDFDHRYKHQH